mmetsp:Transcript_6966/g.16447  ORF Transcript_6966/g.16447 Transcript_6966/m.16447 type:complete len:322 (+) Transcript_6966:549-1514(+)
MLRREEVPAVHHHALQVGRCEVFARLGDLRQVGHRQLVALAQVVAEDLFANLQLGQLCLEPELDPPRAEQRLGQHLEVVARHDDDDMLRVGLPRREAVELREQEAEDVRLVAVRDHVALHHRVHVVDEHDRRRVSLRRRERHHQLAVQVELLHHEHLALEAVRERAPDRRLAGAGRAVQQHAVLWRRTVARSHLRVLKRQQHVPLDLPHHVGEPGQRRHLLLVHLFKRDRAVRVREPMGDARQHHRRALGVGASVIRRGRHARHSQVRGGELRVLAPDCLGATVGRQLRPLARGQPQLEEVLVVVGGEGGEAHGEGLTDES